MATVNKNFKIKNGLVVEGTTGTINGQNILTETGGDTYILNLVGGATLVKSVDTDVFNVDNSGYLTINAEVFDAYGAASTAESNANTYTDTQLESYTPTSSLDTTVGNYGYLKSGDLPTMYSNSDVDNHLSGGDGITYSSGTISADVAGGLHIDGGQIKIDRTSTDTWYDASGAASTAESNANEYTDNLIGDNTIDGTAGNTVKARIDSAVAALVDSAPEALNTLNELAAALGDNVDGMTGIATAIGNKLPLAGGTMSGNIAMGNNKVTGLAAPTDNNDAARKAYVDDAASTAQSNAETYADGLASNYDAAGAAATAEDNANTYTDTAISNGNVSATPTYGAVNIGYYTELVSGWQSTSNGSSFIPLTWNTNAWGTAKLTVHVRSGNHSQASEILLARDSSNNIHITEYAIVSTNGTIADISADVNAGNTRIIVAPTTGHDQTEAVVSGSIIAFAD